MEIQGKIKVIGKTQTFGSNGFQKRELVIVTDEQYPQTLMIEFVQDKCNLLNSFQLGEEVKIDIDLRGREWITPEGDTKYFNSIQGWRINKVENAMEKGAKVIDAVFPPADNLNTKDHDDLPF